MAFSTRLASAWLISSRCREWSPGPPPQRQALVLGERLVKLMNTVGDLGRIEVRHIVAGLTGFGACDHQKRIERADQAVGLVDGPFQRRAYSPSLLDFASASSARLRSRVSGVLRS
jgi:hypothetical protein